MLNYLTIAPKVFVDFLYISGFPVYVVHPKIGIEVYGLCYLFVIALSLSLNLFSFFSFIASVADIQ